MVTPPGLTWADFELEAGFLLKERLVINSSTASTKAKPLAPAETFPSDLAGNPRPKGPGDIGAFRVR